MNANANVNVKTSMPGLLTGWVVCWLAGPQVGQWLASAAAVADNCAAASTSLAAICHSRPARAVLDHQLLLLLMTFLLLLLLLFLNCPSRQFDGCC